MSDRLPIVLHAAIAMRSPRDTQTPKDERERLIEMRATHIAFYVLITGALAGVAVIHVRNSAWLMQQVVLFAIVLAEVVKFGLQVAFYRQGR